MPLTLFTINALGKSSQSKPSKLSESVEPIRSLWITMLSNIGVSLEGVIMLNLDPKEPLIQDELPESERLVDKINRVAGGQAMLSLLLAMIGVFLGLGVDRIFYFVAGGGVLVFIPAAIVARSSMVGYKRVAILATGLKVLGSVSPILVAAAIFMFVSSPVKGATDALLKALFGFVFVYSVWAMRNDFLLSSRIQKALAKDAAEKAQ